MELTKELIDYLDSYEFVEIGEVSMAVLDFMEKEKWDCYPSRGACFYASGLVDEYLKLRNLSFNE